MSDNIERRVRTIIGEVLRIDASEVFLTSRIRSDLDANTAKRVEILCRLEEAFDIKLGLSRAQAWRYVADLVTSVERKLEDKPVAA